MECWYLVFARCGLSQRHKPGLDHCNKEFPPRFNSVWKKLSLFLSSTFQYPTACSGSQPGKKAMLSLPLQVVRSIFVAVVNPTNEVRRTRWRRRCQRRSKEDTSDIWQNASAKPREILKCTNFLYQPTHISKKDDKIGFNSFPKMLNKFEQYTKATKQDWGLPGGRVSEQGEKSWVKVGFNYQTNQSLNNESKYQLLKIIV